MGYTHYYYQKPNLNQTAFYKIARDFKKMVPIMGHLGVKLGDSIGQNTPTINPQEISFNGLEKCGHQKQDIGLAWPSSTAQGVNADYTRKELSELSKGSWFAGKTLETRVCGGDCSYETFSLVQNSERKDKEYFFNCTKTNYKPYDLAVNICLIIAKHYLNNDIVVKSDGEAKDWIEGAQLCQHFLGYGQDFSLDSESPKDEIKKKPVTQIQPIIDKTQIKPGSIFYASWGYDQTNIDYYVVKEISKTGKTCKIVNIGCKVLEYTGFMSERVEPDPTNELKRDNWDEEKRCYTKARIHQASIRKNSNGEIWLRAGTTNGGYLHIYESPNIATHYA